VLITGFADKELVIKAFRFGAFDILEKPIQLQSLNETLDRALEIVNAHLSKKLQDLNLSSNQIRILELLTQGKSNKEIAGVINISEQGVKYHIGNLFRRFSATCRNDLKSIVRKLHTNPVDGPPPLR
jgi:FixJ family two-component response regulator